MGRNRVIGSPYQTATKTQEFTTDHAVDAYFVDAVPLVVTLDPTAVINDQVLIQDVTNAAAGNPIVINVSEGQAIANGYGSSISIDTDGGGVQLTMKADGIWVPQLLAAEAQGQAPPLAHAWGDSAAVNPVSSVAPVVIAEVSITPNKYGSIRVIGTAIVENQAVNAGGYFIPFIGFSAFPGVPAPIYEGDPSGVAIAHVVAEQVLPASVSISYTISGLTPGAKYNVAFMGKASATGVILVAAHGAQVDASEVSQ